ncbi:MAG: tetratricopeptide repeat protein, partial [Alphaproteobacteria bacterium]|nr:tetratricopeptide repeat protein [Alphaproteobacteria bacterium]
MRGDNETAHDLITMALAIDSSYAAAHGNLGQVLQAQGRLEEALASFNTAVILAPSLAESHNNLATLQKDLGRLDDAIESYRMAIALRPDFAEAYCNYGSALQELGRPADALDCFQQALAIRPDFTDAYSNQGGVLRELGRIDEAAASYQQALTLAPDDASAQANLAGLYISGLEDPALAIEESRKGLAMLRRSEFGDARNDTAITRFTTVGIPLFRLKHDVQQADYLASIGHEIAGIAEFRDAGHAILARDRAEPANSGDAAQTLLLSREEARALLPYLQADSLQPMPEVPGAVLNPENDWRDLAEQYRRGATEIMYIDNFLSPEALSALQQFCLGSKVWLKEYSNKYLGAFSDQGFISPLHLQLARELQENIPDIFGDTPLGRFWGYKYDSTLGKGINIHADFALVNLNFWITPDEYNLDQNSGGLKVYDVPSPSNWHFKAYNEEKEEIYKFIESKNASSVNIKYRCNRAVLFNSAYFHETDEITFKDDYAGRRINITYLFGSR